MTASPTYGELTNKGASTNIAWHEASVGRQSDLVKWLMKKIVKHR